MKAYLYYIKFYSNKGDDNPVSVKEFIVFGPSQNEIDTRGIKILNHYKHSLNKLCQYHEYGDALPVCSFIRGRRIKKPIDWKLLQHRREIQEQTRPRDQGSSIFRGLPEADQPSDQMEYRKILRDSVVYFLGRVEQNETRNNASTHGLERVVEIRAPHCGVMR